MCEIVLHRKKNYSVPLKIIAMFSMLFLFFCKSFAQQTDYNYWLDSLQHYYNSPSSFTKEKSKPFPFYLLNDSVKPFASFPEKNASKQKDNFLKTGAVSCTDSSVKTTYHMDTVGGKNPFLLYPEFISRTKDNNVLVPGGYINDITNKQKIQLVKSSPAGKIIWQMRSTYVYGFNYYLYRALELKNGNIFTAGNFEQKDISGNYIGSDLLIMTFKPDGSSYFYIAFKNLLWTDPLNPGSITIHDISEGPDGYIYFTGNMVVASSSSAFILKMDNIGSVSWTKSFSESNNACVAYGINFNDAGNILLYGKYPGAGAPVIFTATLDKNTGDTLSTKAWQTTGTDSIYTSFTNDAYTTKLDNGNTALYGKLFNDGFFYNGRTKYVGMAQFNRNQDFVKGWQVTGDYLSNSADTKIFVHPDSSADFTFNNLIPGHVDSINLFIGNVQNDALAKQRVIKQKLITKYSFNNFSKMDDGGSVAVEQDFDNIISYNTYFLHNTDTASLYFGKDTSFMQMENLDYKKTTGSTLNVASNVVAIDPVPPINAGFTFDTLVAVAQTTITSNCTSFKLSVNNASVCLGAPVIIKASKNKECLQNIAWVFDTTVLQSYNFINDSTLSIIFSKPWKGYVYASVCPSLKDSVLITALQSPGPVNLGADTVICPGNTIILNAKKGYLSYKWQDGSTDSLFTLSAAGKYFVDVKDSCGNSFSDSVNVVDINAGNFTIGNDTTKCNNDTLTLKAPSGFINYNWQPAYNFIQLNDSTIKVFPLIDTSYRITAEKVAGCFVYDTIKISVLSSPKINLGNDTSVCAGDSVLLDAGSGFANYLWSNLSSSQQIKIFSGGQYFVNATAANSCSSKDTINIVVNLLPQPQLGNDTFLCMGKNVILNPGVFKNYLWQDGSISPTYNADSLGKYFVTVTDNNNCVNIDSVNITSINPSPGNLLADTVSFCQGESLTLSTDSLYAAYLWNTGSNASTITINNEGLYWLQATNSFGCSLRDSIKTTFKFCTVALYFPNAFTPNSDGLNDVFKPKIYGLIDKYYLIIYNRFGQKVFETTDATHGWDGRQNNTPAQQATTYVWYCNYQLNGQQMQMAKGTVTVVK